MMKLTTQPAQTLLRKSLGSLVLAAVVGCAQTEGPVTDASNSATGAGATPEVLKSGFDVSDFSTSVRAQDDFFEFVNAEWIASNEIPADRSRYGVFNVVYDRTELQVKDLIEAAAQTVTAGSASADEARIGNAYLSFMNEAKVAELGLAPLADLFLSLIHI